MCIFLNPVLFLLLVQVVAKCLVMAAFIDFKDFRGRRQVAAQAEVIAACVLVLICSPGVVFEIRENTCRRGARLTAMIEFFKVC